MARRDNTYSRVIAWLKIILPLTALALLATVFLFSKDVGPTGKLPFSDVTIENRVARQQITAPYFAGTTAKGETITISANNARPDPDKKDVALGETINVDLKIADGNTVSLHSNGLTLDNESETAVLKGEVQILSSTQYEVLTDAIQISLSELEAETLGGVSASGPAGTLTAGRLKITTNRDTENIHLLFTDGVKLIYEPQSKKE